MNAKNLPLKFSIVAIMVAVSLWSIQAKGCRQGIDLQGGYSLVFEIRSSENEIEQLSLRKTALEAELAKTTEPKKRKEVSDRIASLTEAIAGLRTREERRNLADDMIRILKERIDPQGLRNLEWRPVGSNRIEVRMPAATEETRIKRADYDAALEALEAGNVDRRQMRRYLQSTAQQRGEVLAGLRGEQAKRLQALGEAYDAEQAARKALEAAKASADPAKVKQAQAAFDDAFTAEQDKSARLAEVSIRASRLKAILSNYLTPAEEKGYKKNEIEERHKRLMEDLAQLRKDHPGRVGQIDRVVDAYKAWADVRQRLEDPTDLERLIARAGVLEFRIAGGYYGKEISNDDREHYVSMLKKDGPEEVLRRGGAFAWFSVHNNDRKPVSGLIMEEYAGRWYVLLCNQPGFRLVHVPGAANWALTGAFRDYDQIGNLAIGFEFDEAGAKQFYNLTSSHKGKRMAILLDDEVFSAPTIQSAISNRGQITGKFTSDEVEDMVRLLEAGSLPARLNPNPVAVVGFGPSIGAENRSKGIRAAYMGMIAVAAFMLVYYLLSGAIADVALLLNIVLVLGAMSLLNAVFTLPGIAGVILTIGIAVDANVLIFERLREEQLKGQSVRMAIKNAYERAFSAIFDANITTLITCLILGWVGTLEVRGFAITLGLGVAISLFTALVVTRWIYQLLLDTKTLKGPTRMLSLIRVPNVNWMGKRHLFWGLSGTMIVLGIASLVWQGGNILGIEFSAGTKVTVQFKEDALLNGKLPNDGLVRELFAKEASRLGYEKLRSTARVEMVVDPTKVEDFLNKYDTNHDGKVSQAEAKAGKLKPGFVEELLARLDTSKDGALERDELRNLPAWSYQVSTTDTDVDRIGAVIDAAFGTDLSRRAKVDFKMAANQETPGLGLTTDAEGKARIEVNETSRYVDLLEEYVGGVAIAVKGVEPSMTETEFKQRIKDERYEEEIRQTEVLGLGPPAEEGYRSFVVLVKLEDVLPTRWGEEADKEIKIVRNALEREQALLMTKFDAAIAGRAAQRALIAIVLSWLAIVLYLWLRFGSARWGLAAVICLIHDVIIVVGLVAASGWIYNVVGSVLGIESFKIDLPMVAAIMTVIGYSVNDTIVVFDRIRENRGKLTTITPGVINRSINQTLSRTLLTSGTTFIVVFIMYAWGGQGLKPFNFALLTGVVFGTYSSIAIASPLLMGFRKALVGRIAAPDAAARA